MHNWRSLLSLIKKLMKVLCKGGVDNNQLDVKSAQQYGVDYT